MPPPTATEVSGTASQDLSVIMDVGTQEKLTFTLNLRFQSLFCDLNVI